MARLPSPRPLLLPLLLLAGLVACGPDPDQAPPIGSASAAAAAGDDTGAAFASAPIRASIGYDGEGEFVFDADVYARAQVEFRLAMYDARERLLEALADCDSAATDVEACSARALRAYDLAVAEAGRRTGLRADEIVPIEKAGGIAEGVPVVQVVGSRG